MGLIHQKILTSATGTTWYINPSIIFLSNHFKNIVLLFLILILIILLLLLLLLHHSLRNSSMDNYEIPPMMTVTGNGGKWFITGQAGLVVTSVDSQNWLVPTGFSWVITVSFYLSCQLVDLFFVCILLNLLHSILFYSILFYSILFYSILFYSILFYSILFYSILFYSILFYSPSILFAFYSILCSSFHFT